MADNSDTPKTHAVAIRLGAKFYFTGKPCKRGHVDRRYTIGGACVTCASEWHRRNPELFKSIQKKSYRKNAAKRAQYRAASKERAKEYWKEYKAKNKEKLRAISNRWYWRNREEVAQKYKTTYLTGARAASRNRKARVRGNGGRHTAKDIITIFQSQSGKCACCRARLKSYHVDHIKPLAAGGSNAARNLQLLCVPCNLSKSSRDPVEFMQSRGFLL